MLQPIETAGLWRDCRIPVGRDDLRSAVDLPRTWLVHARPDLRVPQSVATNTGFSRAAPSLCFAVPRRWPVQGSPSLANAFSGAIPSLRNPAPLGHPAEPSPTRSFAGAKVHQTFALRLLSHRIFAFIRFTLRQLPGSLMKYSG